ncbi:hypothetical protein WJX73_006667 [Symbiochloris irregularis]|uniref:Uncharacterized protein n=1 Tax=Symbiochloris irregularis TaxID=706552 RepID=A0AAW1NZH1_9CHLO
MCFTAARLPKAARERNLPDAELHIGMTNLLVLCSLSPAPEHVLGQGFQGKTARGGCSLESAEGEGWSERRFCKGQEVSRCLLQYEYGATCE